MIKLGASYIEAGDIQVATFVNATTVTLTLRGGGQFTANDVPAEDVAAFRDLWDLVAANYPMLVDLNIREKNGIGLKELIEWRTERGARKAERWAAERDAHRTKRAAAEEQRLTPAETGD